MLNSLRTAGRGGVQSSAVLAIAGSLTLAVTVHRICAAGWLASGPAGTAALLFAVFVWRLRAATAWAAFWGAVVCVSLSLTPQGARLPRSGLVPLALLFALTFIATRMGQQGRARSGDDAHGRNAAQVLANLGAAAILSAWPSLMLACLAEATADTVSSELGQRFGGQPWLGLRRVEPGVNGAISALGTGAGIAAAAVVVLAGTLAMGLTRRQGWVALAGGVAGLFFDSLLGNTAERRGWLNNDLVNLSSTVFAAAVALLLLV